MSNELYPLQDRVLRSLKSFEDFSEKYACIRPLKPMVEISAGLALIVFEEIPERIEDFFSRPRS